MALISQNLAADLSADALCITNIGYHKQNYNLMGFDTVEINLVLAWLSENKKTGLMRMVSVENWLSKLLFKYWTNSDQ